MQIKTVPDVAAVFAQYPSLVQKQMQKLRSLVIEVAQELEALEGLNILEECLRWGEPSFCTKHGSTLRMAWKQAKPEQYALYFQCTTSLVETFRSVFGDLFEYEGKRAIVFQLEQEIPETELKKCIKACLNYHKVKRLPALGIALLLHSYAFA